MKSTSLHQLSAAIDERLHQFEEIPLKDESGGDYCGISSCGPTLYVSGRKDDKIFNLPKEGTAKVKFRIRSKTVNYRENGDERYSTDIEVQTIEPTGLGAILDKYEFEDAPAKPERWYEKPVVKAGAKVAAITGGVLVGGGLMEKRASKKLKEQLLAGMKAKRGFDAILDKYEFGDRTRDGGGRFAPGQNVSDDDMATAYVNPKKKALLAGAGVAGLTAAAVSPKARTAIAGGMGRLVRRAME